MALDIQQTLEKSIDSHMNGQDSPVMNETLSVIDEHITDLSTPRHSLAPPDAKAAAGNDSGSEYSATLGHRMSYINGHETDEEEESHPTEDQVRTWSQSETAKHLREVGVESKHCEIFEEQEITGEVLLDMDQDFLFMKEFDFGVMGRRLKTWHKIKAFQEEVKGFKPQSQVPSLVPEERSASRAGQAGSFLPRIPTFSEKSGGYHPSRGSAQQHARLSSIQSNGSNSPAYGVDIPRRPSAASVREFNHSRRHSSIDTTNRSFELADSPPRASHQNKPSLDRAWSMAGGSQRLPPRPGSSLGATESMFPQPVTRGTGTDECDSAISVTDRYDDLDRGYFSGPEGDAKKNKRVLMKRGSTRSGSIGHSRKSSYNDEPFKISISKRHSRISSIDSIRDAAKHTSQPSFSSKHSTGTPQKGRLRSLSTRITDRSSHSAHSSNAPSLEDKSTSGTGFFSSMTPFAGKTFPESSARSTALPFQQHFKNAGPKFRRAVGFRAMADDGKGPDFSLAPSSPARESDPSSARTGSTTPSATSKSSGRHSAERQSTDGSAKATDSSIPLPRPRPSVKTAVKSKKDTSAYVRGLEKKPPQEQMAECDYSGWMKKRSSNLMTTWKPRLFVLRGRRLSYYYADKDPEERGLIDITGHRVLRADNDPIIALHATLTGATASPTSPATSNNTPQLPASKSESSRAAKAENSGPFFFKLVPPKAGVARSVQFTKPAIHYFQVDTVKEGRLWMAALMKATIERDVEHPIETNNKQPTISLKQARMMNQRPPALLKTPTPQEADEEGEEADQESKETNDAPSAGDGDGNGLGLSLDKSPDGQEGRGDTPTPAKPLGSNPLGGLDTGPSTLLPESLKSEK